MEIRENQPLAPLTTFGIGGPARWFAEAKDELDIADACAWASERSLPLFVLGGGSNVLVSDAGFAGLVLRIAVKGIEQEGGLFCAGAGENWDEFVQRAVDAGCAGVECLAGIPGTVGGTPVQNVGAYGQEVASAIERVRVFDRLAQEFVEFTNAECGFRYRHSRFNTTERGRYIVTRVDYQLLENATPQLAYQDLAAHFANASKSPSVVEVAAAVREIRQRKGMLYLESEPDCRSAGSFFKNPEVMMDVADRVRQIAADTGISLRTYPAGEGRVKIPAAWLIEQAGFKKGTTLGAAGISTRHTLALTNRGGAKAGEILALAEKIAAVVEARFGIRLEREPELVGF